MTEKYKITAIPTDKSKIPLRACQKDCIIPKAPFSLMISGRSGSGKTNVLINILTNKDLLKDYFHYIVVFSPTAGKYYDSYNYPQNRLRMTFQPMT